MGDTGVCSTSPSEACTVLSGSRGRPPRRLRLASRPRMRGASKGVEAEVGAGYEGMDIRDSVGADHVGDACDLSRFPSDSRDVVTAWSVIEHVYRPYDMLCEMKRISKGTCILTTDYTERNKNNDPTHLYSWTEKTLRQLVKKVHHDCKVYVDKMMLIGVMYSCGEES